ncbi:diuretic hormone 41-like isoform X2 [Ostrinia nubilalis]|uniref:diuretic hormone 41 isoform X5 n=1 Tax=Ostrinia furnacalis TaxID=93504 RepID=UPI001038F08A|nr:diuretic hormone 41 isoform X5 [Ostrinia furnacalis]
MMWWAVWCAAVVAGSAGAAAAPAPDSLGPLDLVQIDPPAPDDDGVSYAMPPIGGRYGSGAPWLYLLAEMPRDSQVASSQAVRARRSFSVNPAADLLQRNAYISYREQLAKNNRNFLDRVGKRDPVQLLRLAN